MELDQNPCSQKGNQSARLSGEEVNIVGVIKVFKVHLHQFFEIATHHDKGRATPDGSAKVKVEGIPRVLSDSKDVNPHPSLLVCIPVRQGSHKVPKTSSPSMRHKSRGFPHHAFHLWQFGEPAFLGRSHWPDDVTHHPPCWDLPKVVFVSKVDEELNGNSPIDLELPGLTCRI
eukprot:Lithocolla_globosa_v1_NODE_3787_length_1580_cov_9.760000.p2 type:complete len:173 gc:universal NODE_3787_length_1580_cov_9.760000:847-329(-)